MNSGGVSGGSQLGDFVERKGASGAELVPSFRGAPESTFPMCGLINDYRSLSNYLKEFSDFIHWYEQMFDRKPW